MPTGILIEHPDHGQMTVYTQWDVAYNSAKGWKRVPLPKEKVEKVVEEKKEEHFWWSNL